MPDKTLDWMGRIAIADGLLSEEEETILKSYAIAHGIAYDSFITELRTKVETIETRAIAINANVIKGIEFENFIFEKINDNDNIKIISRSTDFKLGLGNSLDERSLAPDFLLSHSIGRFNIRYWLECKYRSKPNTLNLKSSQIERYLSIESKTSQPVFIMYGEGGKSTSPQDIYLFHISEVIDESIAYKTQKGNYIVNQDLLFDYHIDISKFNETIKNFMNL